MVFGPFEFFFHEVTMWSVYRAVISFILTKKFPTFLSSWESVLWPISKFGGQKKSILMMMVLARNQNWNFKEDWSNILVVIQYRQCLIDIGKRQDIILVKKEKQLGKCFFLGQDSVKLKVTWKWGHVYKMLSSILPQELENLLTNWNYTDSALLEEWRIHIYLRLKIPHVWEMLWTWLQYQ